MRTVSRRRFVGGGLAAAVGSAFWSSSALGQTEAPQVESLKTLAAPFGITTGVSASRRLLSDAHLASFVTKNFSLVTPPVEFKWEKIRPNADHFDFTDADWFLNFASQHSLRIHGHNLCWNDHNPEWMKATITKNNAARFLTEHIHAVVGRYKGRIPSWDVVNEPVRASFHRPDGLNQGLWLDTLGPDYIDIAFHASAQADPSALLVLNLDSVEQEGALFDANRASSLALVKNLLRRGVPVQAIGLESHLYGERSTTCPGRTRFVKALQALGLQVFISELDVNDTSVLAPSTQQRQQSVGKTYHDYLADVVVNLRPERVVFWSLTNQGNWLEGAAKNDAEYRRADGAAHYPGLLNVDRTPTPAFNMSVSAFVNSAHR
jgi:endo-1,4-beta-xylanase